MTLLRELLKNKKELWLSTKPYEKEYQENTYRYLPNLTVKFTEEQLEYQAQQELESHGSHESQTTLDASKREEVKQEQPVATPDISDLPF